MANPFDSVAHASRMSNPTHAADDFEVIGRRLQEIKSGNVTDYVAPVRATGTLTACECGRTTEAPEQSPCTGACGLPPGGRAGQGAQSYDCGG